MCLKIKTLIFITRFNIFLFNHRYCGTSVQGSSDEIKSYSNFSLIIFRSNWGQSRLHRGFSIEATAISSAN